MVGVSITLDVDVINRLVFIKYMFNQGVELSKKSYPDSQMAVLTFHDAVELFLYLSCEYLQVSNLGNTNFIGYFDKIKNSSSKLILSQKIQMIKLNKARVELKHRGVLIGDSTIEELRVNVRNFFEENTRTVFDVDFQGLTLIDLVKNQSAKNKLLKANEFLDQGDFNNSLLKSAQAFDELLDDYENRSCEPFGINPYDFANSMTRMKTRDLKEYFKSFSTLSKFVDNTKTTIELMGNALKIIGLGIDYKKFVKFKRLTPLRVKIESGPSRYYFSHMQKLDDLNEEDVQFCIDFVIESALMIQDFPFSN